MQFTRLPRLPLSFLLITAQYYIVVFGGKKINYKEKKGLSAKNKLLSPGFSERTDLGVLPQSVHRFMLPDWHV